LSLFGKKTSIRFETITVDREKDVFRALENKGWTLCSDPFQFDVQKSHEKLRKDALKMAKELHAELLVEVWDPIYQHMHWKGLKYGAWRMATREELLEREKAKQLTGRPDYSDSLGSIETIAQKLEDKQIHVNQDELHQYDEVLVADKSQMTGEVYGNSDEDMGMVTEHFDTISTLNPYDHQGENQSEIRKDTNVDQEAARQGPVFDESQKLELGEDPMVDQNLAEAIDPLALMMEAAPTQEKVPQTGQAPQTPQVALPPQVAEQAQPPANVPPVSLPTPQMPAGPPALGAPPQLPQPPSPAPAALPKPSNEIKEEEEKGQ
jgi:hypothetical protein